jgi:primosomal protein N''
MQTTIKTHLNELQTSATRMLVLNSDNKMLISYFKDLTEKLIYLQQLVEMDSKYNWLEIENLIVKLKEVDTELTHVNIEVQIAEVKTEKKSAAKTDNKAGAHLAEISPRGPTSTPRARSAGCSPAPSTCSPPSPA